MFARANADMFILNFENANNPSISPRWNVGFPEEYVTVEWTDISEKRPSTVKKSPNFRKIAKITQMFSAIRQVCRR